MTRIDLMEDMISSNWDNRLDEYLGEITETNTYENLEDNRREEVLNRTPMTLNQTLFDQYIKKHSIDITLDFIALNFKDLIYRYGYDQSYIKYAINTLKPVQRIAIDNGTIDISSHPVISSSRIITGNIEQGLVTFADADQITDSYSRLANLMGSRIFIINALDLTIEAPVINEALNIALEGTSSLENI